MSTKLLPLACIAGLAAVTAGCGEFIRQDRSSSLLVIDALQAASGADDTLAFSGTLQSDVITAGSVFSDPGQVTMRVIMKDLASPLTPTNTITINRYLVNFRRADGRNTPGVDVPFPFDSALTFTVTSGTTGITRSFELIRHNAKFEQPLLGLANSFVTISTIADVTFFGRDQAGNELSATGSIGVQFGNFADPE
jgi:hypothetical protein